MPYQVLWLNMVFSVWSPWVPLISIEQQAFGGCYLARFFRSCRLCVLTFFNLLIHLLNISFSIFNNNRFDLYNVAFSRFSRNQISDSLVSRYWVRIPNLFERLAQVFCCCNVFYEWKCFWSNSKIQLFFSKLDILMISAFCVS